MPAAPCWDPGREGLWLWLGSVRVCEGAVCGAGAVNWGCVAPSSTWPPGLCADC